MRDFKSPFDVEGVPFPTISYWHFSPPDCEDLGRQSGRREGGRVEVVEVVEVGGSSLPLTALHCSDLTADQSLLSWCQLWGGESREGTTMTRLQWWWGEDRGQTRTTSTAWLPGTGATLGPTASDMPWKVRGHLILVLSFPRTWRVPCIS